MPTHSIASVDRLTVIAIAVMAYAGAYITHGAALVYFSFRVCRTELARLIGFGGPAARSIAWRLVVPAYLAGGIVTVASAFFSELDAKIAQLQAAGGTFGLTIWLLVLPLVITGPATGEVFRLRRSAGWIMAGALTAIIFIGVLGPGITM